MVPVLVCSQNADSSFSEFKSKNLEYNLLGFRNYYRKTPGPVWCIDEQEYEKKSICWDHFGKLFFFILIFD